MQTTTDTPAYWLVFLVALAIHRLVRWMDKRQPSYYTWNEGRPHQTRVDRTADGCLMAFFTAAVWITFIVAVAETIEAVRLLASSSRTAAGLLFAVNLAATMWWMVVAG